MKNNLFTEVVDIAELSSLFEDFTRLTGFVTALLDMEGNVLVATGWQEVCTRFHRQAPGAARKCLESDTILADRLRQGEKYSVYQCKNGLIDVAVPIVIDGTQIGRLYSGQFLFEPPDMEFFKRQAAEYGFDEASYLDAVRKVPVVSKEQMRQVMAFLCRLAEIIVRMGVTNKRIDDADLIVRKSPVILFRWRTAPGWPIEYVSENVDQFGYSPEELISGQVPYLSMVHPEDLDRVAAEVSDYSAKWVDNFQKEYRIVAKNGEIHWVYDNTVIERDGSGEIRHYQGIVIDITERKRAEDELINAHKELDRLLLFNEALLSAIPTPVFYKDREGRYLGCNRAFTEFMGVTPEELKGKTVFDLWPGEHAQEYHRKDLELMADPVRQMYDFKVRDKNGVVRPVIYAKGVFRDENGQAAGIVGAFLDITERKQAEEKIKAALAEKEVLLKEIHHRVKNNLQIVSTLLDLQSENIGDERIISSFRESQHRIYAMALIHESLYKSTDIASVNFGRYVRDLSQNLVNSYLAEPGRIDLELQCGDIDIAIDQAIPCGLIVNELVSNALKHAFPNNRPGELTIEFHIGENGMINLKVADNGVGLPENLDITNTDTLGLQLVNTLARQLRGEVRIEGGQGGTAFVITFPSREPIGIGSA